MKRILLFAFSVLLLLSPVSLLAQGVPSIKPGQLQTKPIIPLPPNKDLRDLDERIRSQEAQRARRRVVVGEIQECLDFYSSLKGVFNGAGASTDADERYIGTTVCRRLHGPSSWHVDLPEFLAYFSQCSEVPDFLDHDLGSCPLPGAESSPVPSDLLLIRRISPHGEGPPEDYICVNPTKFDEARERCNQEIDRQYGY